MQKLILMFILASTSSVTAFILNNENFEKTPDNSIVEKPVESQQYNEKADDYLYKIWPILKVKVNPPPVYSRVGDPIAAALNLEAEMRAARKLDRIIGYDTEFENAVNKGIKEWDFTLIVRTIYNAVLKRSTNSDKFEALNILEKFGPPTTLLDAVDRLSPEQKGEIALLIRSRDVAKINLILNGILISLPREDQDQKYLERIKGKVGKERWVICSNNEFKNCSCCSFSADLIEILIQCTFIK
ncbi:unnamed protein product [Enterobius vermicularis]|uniref:DUF5667 domain-containing protein n=1 Tax=Enterobius vermicularis TaxID=51028 RepID=A0A0N4V0N6_ENTVE|nr:unnamed protein product [Enterobius vermicularis]